MIPLSSRIEKFRKIIEKKEQSGKTCDILHIVKLDDSRESVFLEHDIITRAKRLWYNKPYTITPDFLIMIYSKENGGEK